MSKRLALAVALAAIAITSPAVGGANSTAPQKTLTAFASEKELADLLGRWAQEARRREGSFARRAANASGVLAQSVPTPAAPASFAAKEAAMADSVTNVQHAGVDEGGIVKMHGDHLVILRRGRLFTVAVGEDQLQPVSSIDAFGPDVDPGGAWYDAMLISENLIAIIGYSYARGGTEVGLFEISRAGNLAYKGTYHLRSNDYYSSRNYASRLIGTKLVFYSPHFLSPWAADPYAAFPPLRRRRLGATQRDFKRIAPPTRSYRTDEPLDPSAGVALPSVPISHLATH